VGSSSTLGNTPFEANYTRPVHSLAYASPCASLRVSQGSLPAARARFAGRDFHPLDDETEFQCFIVLLLSVLPFLVAPHVGVTEVRAHVGASVQSRLERTTIRTQALDALVSLGFKRHEARSAVDQAIAHFGDAPFTLESFIRVSLGKSPRPRSG
jgi:hypothetical protein